MRDITGYDYDGLNVDSLTLIADLIYFDGPLLSHYVSPQGDNYLFYWVDSDEKCNRWLVIKVSLSYIQDYINKKVTLLDIIRNRSDKSVFVIDIDNELKVEKLLFTGIGDLPADYFPKDNSYYEFEPHDCFDLTALSKKYKQGIFELKFTGEGVSYGTIPLEKLSAVLAGFEGIRNALAVDYIKEKRVQLKKEKELYKKKLQTEQVVTALERIKAQEKMLLLDTSYETIYRAAGSFRLLFRPKNTQLALWQENNSIADEFASQIVTFLKAGESVDSLREFVKQYDRIIVKKLENFVGEVNKAKLNIDVKWCNDLNQKFVDYNLPYKFTSQILDNLATFDYDDEVEIEITGNFFAIDLKNGSYYFEGELEKSRGKFFKDILPLVYAISFNKKYKVKVHRRFIRPIGKKENIIDTLLSFTPETEV